jgi:O-methyltransferase
MDWIAVKRRVRSALPGSVREWARLGLHPAERRAVAGFVQHGPQRLSRAERLALVRRYMATSAGMTCAHTQEQMLSFASTILDLPDGVPGVVVEAGCFKGGSTAKFSLAARAAGRKLVVFDSFEGIPPNDEDHGHNLFGQHTPHFAAGEYRGALEEVKGNVARWGAPEVCEYVQGWFENSMPGFHQPVAAAYVDVDLASSTRTCLKYLYPLLVPGGAIFSHDGHLPLVQEVLRDDGFWQDEVGYPRPPIEGLGERKLVVIRKPQGAAPIAPVRAEA